MSHGIRAEYDSSSATKLRLSLNELAVRLIPYTSLRERTSALRRRQQCLIRNVEVLLHDLFIGKLSGTYSEKTIRPFQQLSLKRTTNWHLRSLEPWIVDTQRPAFAPSTKTSSWYQDGIISGRTESTNQNVQFTGSMMITVCDGSGNKCSLVIGQLTASWDVLTSKSISVNLGSVKVSYKSAEKESEISEQKSYSELVKTLSEQYGTATYQSSGLRQEGNS